MNKTQKIILIVGIAAFTLCGLFVPYTIRYERGDETFIIYDGHGLVFFPPRSNNMAMRFEKRGHDATSLYFLGKYTFEVLSPLVYLRLLTIAGSTLGLLALFHKKVSACANFFA